MLRDLLKIYLVVTSDKNEILTIQLYYTLSKNLAIMAPIVFKHVPTYNMWKMD